MRLIRFASPLAIVSSLLLTAACSSSQESTNGTMDASQTSQTATVMRTGSLYRSNVPVLVVLPEGKSDYEEASCREYSELVCSTLKPGDRISYKTKGRWLSKSGHYRIAIDGVVVVAFSATPASPTP